ncbi:MAG: SUMF1/EgtB/PvdO family nonheme iron enzyme [Anaerolineae bacterium]
MPKIFISYRRSDSRTFTDRIHDRLVEVFGAAGVFQDVDDIPPGADFRVVLREAVESCDVVLVMIGPQWAGVTDAQGRKRLFNTADFVRIEVQTALDSNKLVIPVLIEGASPPTLEELPDSLHELAYLNAINVRHNPDFSRDMERLARHIKNYEEKQMLLSQSTATFELKPPISDVTRGVTNSQRNQEAERIKAEYLEIESHKQAEQLMWEPYKFGGSERPHIIQQLTAAVLKVLPPPFEWCIVQGGSVNLATVPPRTYTVDDFMIAKFTITNPQFQVFEEAKDGYGAEKEFRWYDFSEGARNYRTQNSKLDSTGFKGDNLPRTNVSWYDAVAFTRWLSNKTGQHITLPTEQQWQRAAVGDTGWEYPWGDKFEKSRCCSNTKSPVAVTAYEDGASPYGVVQMSGNVWEWCSTDYDNPDASDIKASANSRVLRGGSWFNTDSSSLRAASRIRYNPYGRRSPIGFRFVLSAPFSGL